MIARASPSDYPLRWYRQVWLCDFEFGATPGDRPAPRCMVAREFRTGRTIRLWDDELAALDGPPFPIGDDALLVAYFASAELGCFLSLDWPLPTRILDLFAEFRVATNGRELPAGNSLVGALAYHGLPSIDAAEKTDMRALALRGGFYTAAERVALLDYCETDVLALAKLLPAMLPTIDLPRALLRGRYMAAVARMEATGTPIDVELLGAIRGQWETIKSGLVREVDSEFGVYILTGRTINPDSAQGAAILDAAERAGVDQHTLAHTLDEVWQADRQAHAEREAALSAARKATGLNSRRAGQWEDSGRDSSTFPGLDVKARELAAENPALGIGPGYQAGENYDAADYAGDLWQLLREPAQPSRPKHDPELIRQAVELARQYGESSGPLSFNAARFAEWLARNSIPWPRLESGALALDDDTFRQMSKAYPAVAPLRELRHTLGELRLFDLAVGSDGRNRCLLSPFRSKTGRNQPSNARFIFGPSCWLRGLIKPEAGRAVVYVDWSQQEFGIAAALSGDLGMMEAYTSGDPYLAFAKQAGAVPADATKQSHAAERERFKVCALAVQYGMAAESLAGRLGSSPAHAAELLRLHRATYPRFWRWSQSAVDRASLGGDLWTVFGWRIRFASGWRWRSAANFPVQANGADMLRLACCLATERGIAVCAPVHDALLVEGPAESIGDVVTATQAAMSEASRVVLGGFELRSDAKIIRHPDRYMDARGERMWEVVTGLLTPTGDGSEWPIYLGQNDPPVQSLFSC